MKHSSFSDKTLTVLSCSIAVAVMILLLSGDMIISKFIQVHPNQNVLEENQEKKQDVLEDEHDDTHPVISDSSYDVSFLKQTDLKDILNHIQNNETVFLFSGRSTCGPCRLFLPVLKEVFQEFETISGYYLNRNEVVESNEYYEFIHLSNILEEKFGSTPFFMIFQNGELKDYIIGMNPSTGALKDEIVLKMKRYL